MPSFGKKNYTNPVIGKHDNDIAKDWYVFFRFKYEGKVYKFKRREGVNRIKEFQERCIALKNLLNELFFDLKHGWNPIIDPKREIDYIPLTKPKKVRNIPTPKKRRKRTKAEMYEYYNNKGITY